MTEWLQSPTVAKILGVKTSTLRKWRAKGTGPAGWVKAKKNVVVYPRENVQSYYNEAKRQALKEGSVASNLLWSGR